MSQVKRGTWNVKPSAAQCAEPPQMDVQGNASTNQGDAVSKANKPSAAQCAEPPKMDVQGNASTNQGNAVSKANKPSAAQCASEPHLMLKAKSNEPRRRNEQSE